MNTKNGEYAVIQYGIRMHTSTHRGCAIVANRRGGDIILSSLMTEIEMGISARKELIKIQEKIASENKKKIYDDATELIDNNNQKNGWEYKGELRRAIIALNRHEIKNRTWCGTFFGGNMHDRDNHVDMYYPRYSSSPVHTNSERIIEIEKYAKEVYLQYAARGDREGMHRSSDVIAATLLPDVLFYY